METPVNPPAPPSAPYAPYAPPAAPPPKSKTPVVVVVLLGSCGCALLMIPILAAILFPVFAQARAKARAVTCLSHEKQMGLGVMMYAQDYDETFPAAPQWMTQINPYVKNPAVYACPSVDNHAQTEAGGVYSYAYNTQLSKRSMALVKAPQLAGMLYDSTAMTENASDALTSLPVPGRHQGRNNVAFGDGHAKSLDSLQMQELVATPESALFEKPEKGQ